MILFSYMKRKGINFLSLIIVVAFLMQATSFIQSETSIANNEMVLTVVNEQIQDSVRKLVLHFDSQLNYANFLAKNDVKLEFPNLKMVLLEGRYDKNIIKKKY